MAEVPTFLRSQTIASLSDMAGEKFGDRVAIISGTRWHSFREIAKLVASLSGGLAELGIGRGDRVIIHLPNGWEWIVTYYAVLRLGAITVPANILLIPEEVAFIAMDAGAVAIVTRLDKSEIGIDLVVIGDRSEGGTTFSSLLEFQPAEAARVIPTDIATISYTSGTTGKPKGAMLSHGAVMASVALTATMHVRQPGEVVVSALPFAHVYGNVVFNSVFLVGMTLVTTERFDARETLDAIERHRATIFEGVPTMYYYMLADAALASRDLSSLRRCTVGGQTISRSRIEAIEKSLGCPLLELWGMTELAGPAATHSPYTAARPGTVGLPLPGMEAAVVDLADCETRLPPGNAGELVVRGPQLMRGYYRNAAATAEVLDREGWLHTGDIATLDEDGYVTIIDRRKDMLITAGYNVYPAEIEQVIAAHPAVSMVAVASVDDAEKGELAKAFVVLRADAALSESDLVAYCRDRLAAYKVPRLIAFVNDLPKTSTGKILRRALRESSEIPERAAAGF